MTLGENLFHRRQAVRRGARAIHEPRSYLPRGRQAVILDPEGAAFGILASSSGDPPDVLAEPGEWIWSSLLTANAGVDIAFYQEMFGYEVYDLESADAVEHAILSTEDYARASVNSLPPDSARRRPHWLNFVCVTNAEQAAERATDLGGRIIVAPRVDRHGSRFAVLVDPSGTPFGVMEWSAVLGDGEAK